MRTPPQLNATTRSLRGAMESIVLSAKLREDLRSLSREREATPFMVLLSAFYILLFRYTDQEDFAVGCQSPAQRTSGKVTPHEPATPAAAAMH